MKKVCENEVEGDRQISREGGRGRERSRFLCATVRGFYDVRDVGTLQDAQEGAAGFVQAAQLASQQN